MNGRRFDDVARLIAGRASRRTILKAALGTAVGARLGLPAFRAAPVSAQALPSSFLVDAQPFFENSARVFSPSAEFPGGRLVLSVGSPGTELIRRRALLGADGLFDVAATTVGITLPEGAEDRITTDNIVVRLREGGILSIRNGCIWSDLEPELQRPWFVEEKIKPCGGYHPRNRGSIHVHFSPDGETWEPRTIIDFAVIANGEFGYPRPYNQTLNAADCLPYVEPGSDPTPTPDPDAPPPPTMQEKDANGNLLWWMGSGDRSELYACPFTGNIYLSTSVVSGPYLEHTKVYKRMLLFRSADQGYTWEFIKDNFTKAPPLVMTSTPDGRLWMLYVKGEEPTLFFTKEPVSLDSVPTLSGPHIVHYVDDGQPVPSGMDFNKDKGDYNPDAVDQRSATPVPTLSRISTDATTSKIRIAYPSLNANGRQEYRIISAEVKDPEQPPEVLPIRTIRALDPENYSVLFADFVEPDFIDLPADAPSNTSMLYWLEAPRKGVTEKAFTVRYLLFTGDFDSYCPEYLSVENGQPHTWGTRKDIGDYMHGAFFWTEGTLNYLGHWSEPDGTKANIVSAPYSAPYTGPPPDMTISAVWEKSDAAEAGLFDWETEIFLDRRAELYADGWLIEALDARVRDDLVFYSASWRPAAGGEYFEYNRPAADFKARYDELYADGWRIETLTAFELKGSVRYSGTLRQTAVEELLDLDMPAEEFKSHVVDQFNAGYRLAALAAYERGGEIFFGAVWRPGTDGELGVFGWAIDDFQAEYAAREPEGWRLHLYRTFALEGTPLCAAVWRQTGAEEANLYQSTFRDFKRSLDELYCEGWRMKLVAVG